LLKPIATALAKHLRHDIAFADDCVGPGAGGGDRGMKNGDILCLENTRFHIGEEKNDPAYVEVLAALSDIWVNHAFSVSHCAHASIEGPGGILWPPRS
jgi:phosphoglycerate kinase